MPKPADQHYRSLFSQMLNGLAYCKVLTDGPAPHDFVYLEVNQAFEEQTGLRNVVGKKVSEVVPGIREQDPWLLDLYSEVATTGRPRKFERYVEALKAWFSVSVYSPEKGHFIAVFDVTTRQREAEELRAARDDARRLATELQTLLDALPAAVYITRDPSARHMVTNRYGADLMKVPMDANVSKSAPEGERPRTFKAMKNGVELAPRHLPVQVAAAQGVDVRDFEFDLVTEDGVARHLLGNASPLRDESGTLAGAVGAFVDVTAMRNAETKIRESEARLAAVVEGGNDGFVDIDVPTGTVHRSRRYWEIAGWPPDSPPTNEPPFLALVHEDDAGRVRAAAAELMAGRVNHFDQEHRIRSAAGTWTWVHLRVKAVAWDEQGKPLRIAGTLRDISRRKQAEEALAASEAKYRRLFDSLMDGFVIADMDGVIRESNEVYRRMLGYSAEELAHLTYKDLTPERWHPVEARILAEQILPRGYSEVYEKEYRRKDGTVFPAELRTFLLKEGGRPVAMWAIVRDVTDVRALQVKLAVAGRMAALGTLVSGVAHEINNPLSAEMADQGVALEVVREVRGRLGGDAPIDRVAEARALDGVIEALQDAQEGGARIGRIVKDLTVFGRPDAKRQPVRLMDIVHGAMRWLPATIARTASIQVENAGAPEVVASAGQIEQVLVNLVTNAAKATPAGQRDTVIVRVGPGSPGMARVDVIDHGTGVDPAIRDHLFDPFFTTRPTGPERGTGLGLAICQAIATSHGGTLTFESELGKGSTFRLELPVAHAGA